MMVKFCGMTNLKDVLIAVDLGVDFVGFVFYEKSKRFVKYEKVREIIKNIKGNVKTVGVFVEQSDSEIKNTMDFCGLDYAQVYRDIDGIDSIRVYRIKNELPDTKRDGLILFDSYTKTIGGSGISFDVGLLKDFKRKDRLFVAGGISVYNVESVMEMDVFGVDLVSSIESYPGKKDVNKMKEFLRIVKG